MTRPSVSRFAWLLCLPALVLALGCQPAVDADVEGLTELEAMMVGHWVVQQANVTFFDPVTGDPISYPADVNPDYAVPVDFFDATEPVMLQFGGDFLFGDGWWRIGTTIIEDGVYVRNSEEELAANPPPADGDMHLPDDESWSVDEHLRLVIIEPEARVEAMVDMADDAASVWFDYDREAPLFTGTSCINSVYVERVD
ncbi:MAG: hypothetical protein VX498_14345 [Myxococcota bacterium]|nr:hypothetical protein [Myxococcota bacterium]